MTRGATWPQTRIPPSGCWRSFAPVCTLVRRGRWHLEKVTKVGRDENVR